MTVKNETAVEATPGGREIVIKRTVDAPRDRVFAAFTEPELLEQWLGPKRLSTKVEQQEARAGGSWRFLNFDDDGNEYAFRGVFHDVVVPERIVRTFEFEGAPGHVSLETLTLADSDGATELTMLSVFQTVEARDAMIEAGMERGVNEGFEKMDALLAEPS